MNMQITTLMLMQIIQWSYLLFTICYKLKNIYLKFKQIVPTMNIAIIVEREP
jgi:hypothetical protein